MARVMASSRAAFVVAIVALTSGVASGLKVEPGSSRPATAPEPDESELRRRGSLCNHHSSSVTLNECIPCVLHDRKAPRLFVEEEYMGVGERFFGIINTMAVAARHGMNLGGVVSNYMGGKQHGGQNHGIDVLASITAMLGLRKPGELFVDCPPTNVSAVFDGPEDLQEKLAGGLQLEPKGKYMLRHGRRSPIMADIFDSEDLMRKYYTPKFVEALRWSGAPIQSIPLDFKPGKLSVALHVRRGDQSVDCYACRGRVTVDEWNFWMMDQIRSLAPDADIHVFSSLEGKHRSSEFDQYRERATVHLDDYDILSPWAHFVRADVVVTAKSPFSILPAFLNPNCVVWQRAQWRGLWPLGPNWIRAISDNRNGGKDNETWHRWFNKTALEVCMKQVSEKKNISIKQGRKNGP